MDDCRRLIHRLLRKHRWGRNGDGCERRRDHKENMVEPQACRRDLPAAHPAGGCYAGHNVTSSVVWAGNVTIRRLPSACAGFCPIVTRAGLKGRTKVRSSNEVEFVFFTSKRYCGASARSWTVTCLMAWLQVTISGTDATQNGPRAAMTCAQASRCARLVTSSV